MIHARIIIPHDHWKLLYSQKSGILFCSGGCQPYFVQSGFFWITADPKHADSGERLPSSMLFCIPLFLQTHQVLSEAKKSDAEKREKLLDLYVRTEEFLDQLDTDFIETLQASLGDFKTTLKENIESFKPRDQYIVLVAGKLFLLFVEKRDIKYIQRDIKYIPIV